mmetsp:Transcript_95885/g.243749  ORF Transcript_95885/g.243749 Transcript_95885/m.243749 type:complete len:235 (+) Transcript_95885:436-1140(+)
MHSCARLALSRTQRIAPLHSDPDPSEVWLRHLQRYYTSPTTIRMTRTIRRSSGQREAGRVSRGPPWEVTWKNRSSCAAPPPSACRCVASTPRGLSQRTSQTQRKRRLAQRSSSRHTSGVSSTERPEECGKRRTLPRSCCHHSAAEPCTTAHVLGGRSPWRSPGWRTMTTRRRPRRRGSDARVAARLCMKAVPPRGKPSPLHRPLSRQRPGHWVGPEHWRWPGSARTNFGRATLT